MIDREMAIQTVKESGLTAETLESVECWIMEAREMASAIERGYFFDAVPDDRLRENMEKAGNALRALEMSLAWIHESLSGMVDVMVTKTEE